MENSKSVRVATITMSTTDSPIQGEEVSHGEGGKGISPSSSPQLELKSGDAVEKEKPLVKVGHKRKASRDIDLFGESDDELHPNNNVNMPPISSPTAGQQFYDEMLPQEGGGSEIVEGDKGVFGGGRLELDLNQAIVDVEEEMKIEANAIENNEVDETYVAESIEVKPSAVEKIEVEPSAVENKEVGLYCIQNKQMVCFDVDEIGVEPYVVEKNEMESSPFDKIEVTPYAVVEKNEVEPYSSTEKHEAGPSTAGENEVETFVPVKFYGLRSSKVFELDLNELPPEEDQD